ncbi:hypothetical protein BT63DRAFT_420184 [Microthyrium microscopicum]|uniref:Uncharacterized protein n=1 Tax=Microthyrium microscopicum TaxID=703497 RepID=A0A6A6UU05_9PEZI|nr:hypothetical protein BT63DRAFT_420184 [Microthyrium microscopicum]
MIMGMVALTFTVLAWPGKKEVRVFSNSASHSIDLTFQVYRLPPCRTYPVVMIFNYLVTMATITYVFIAHQKSTRFNPTILATILSKDNPGATVTYPGLFDLETWSCSIQALGSDEFGTPCKVERAQRWLFIPLAIMNFMCACSGVWAHSRDREIYKVQQTKRHEEKRMLSMASGQSAESDTVQSPEPTLCASRNTLCRFSLKKEMN